MKKLILFVITISLCSCTFIVKKAMHITDPKYISIDKVNKFALKNGLDTGKIFYTNFESIKYVYSGTFPKVFFYHAESKELAVAGSCFQQLNQVIDSLEKNKSYPMEDKEQRWTFEQVKASLFNPKSDIADVSGYDYIIAYYWGAWMGDLNKQKIIPLEQRIKKTGKKYKLILINADFISNWGVSEKEIDTFMKEK